MNRVFFCLLLFLVAPELFSQTTYIEKVYLKNGSIIRGVVVEQVLGKSIKVKTSDGSLWVFAYDQVEKIVKEEALIDQQVNTDSINPDSQPAQRSTRAELKSSRFQQYTVGIGFQYTMPTFGASLMLNVSPGFSIQFLGSFIGEFKTYGGKFLVRLSSPSNVQPYAYAAVGAWTYQPVDVSPNYNAKSETVLGLGGGLGIQYFLSDLPQLGFDLEMGFASVKFNNYSTNFSAFSVGSGLHYFF